MKKRILSVLLIITVFFSMFFASAITVYATKTVTSSSTVTWVEEKLNGYTYQMTYYHPIGQKDFYIINYKNNAFIIFYDKSVSSIMPNDVRYGSGEFSVFMIGPGVGFPQRNWEQLLEICRDTLYNPDSTWRTSTSTNANTSNITLLNEENETLVSDEYIPLIGGAYALQNFAEMSPDQSLTHINQSPFLGMELCYESWYVTKYGENPPATEQRPTEPTEGGGNEGEDKSWWDSLCEWFGQRFEDIGNWFAGIGETIAKWFQTLINNLAEWFGEVTGIRNAIDSAIEAAGREPTEEEYQGFFKNISEKVASHFELTRNGFYEGITAISEQLSSLYNEDYSNPDGFYQLGLTNFSLTRPTTIITKDYGNEIIGEFNQDYEIKTSKINYGINNMQLLNMDWFFGVDAGNGYRTRGVKRYSDTIISAFMWLVFGWYLWHNFPSLVGGELGQTASVTGSAITTYRGTKEEKNITRQKEVEKPTKENKEKGGKE